MLSAVFEHSEIGVNDESKSLYTKLFWQSHTIHLQETQLSLTSSSVAQTKYWVIYVN